MVAVMDIDVTSNDVQLNPLPLAPGRWQLDTNHFRVGFAIRHLGVSKVRGQFLGVTADLVVGSTIADSSLVVVVDLASIDTGNTDRDAHVKSDELLDVARRPTMTFRATDLRGDGDDLTLVGDLTIGEVTRPVSFAVEFGGVERFPGDESLHAGFEAVGEIRRKDFGLDAGLLAGTLLGEVVKVELDIQFVAVEATSTSAD
jgi:polyisoprenoid-binding protein YceI